MSVTHSSFLDNLIPHSCPTASKWNWAFFCKSINHISILTASQSYFLPKCIVTLCICHIQQNVSGASSAVTSTLHPTTNRMWVKLHLCLDSITLYAIASECTSITWSSPISANPMIHRKWVHCILYDEAILSYCFAHLTACKWYQDIMLTGSLANVSQHYHL